MLQNFYELVWIFIIYAFISWCTEVSYAALDRGIFVNRGFLNGPYCPILWLWCCDCRCGAHSIERQSADIVYRVFLLTSTGIYYWIFTGKKVFHKPVVGLF